MQIKHFTILIWLLPIIFSQVSSILIFQGNHKYNIDLTPDFVKTMVDKAKSFGNQIFNGSKKIQNVNDFVHKKLVKRTIPHGYGINEVEYDDKFKTLFKPLIRIHKNRLDQENSRDVKDLHELIYVLDDERFEDTPNLNKDEDLIKPFTSDNTKIKYLSNENYRDKYIINQDVNKSDVDYESYQINELKRRYDNIITEINSNNKLKHVFETKKEQSANLNQVSKVIKRLLDNIIKNKILIPNTDPKHQERFVSIEHQLSNKLKPERNQIENIRDNALNSFILQTLHNKNTDNTKLGTYKLLNNLANIKAEKLPFFGPIGVINSKQFTKIYQHEDQNLKKYELRFPPKIFMKDFIHPIPDKSSEDYETADYERAQNIRGFFGSVGHINSKHLTYSDLKRDPNSAIPIYIYKQFYRQNNGTQETRNKKSQPNRYSSPEVDNNVNKNHPKEEKIFAIEKLRSHVKSGEEEETAKKQMQQFDYHDEEATERQPILNKVHYPFWNYWTYEKQIVEDDCKGKLIQMGRLCIGAWA